MTQPRRRPPIKPQRNKAVTKSKMPRKAAPPQRPSAPRLIIHRLELMSEGKRLSEDVSDHFGMTQIASLSRLIEWFAGQSEEVQAAVLSRHAPADGNDVAQTILARIAKRDMSRKA